MEIHSNMNATWFNLFTELCTRPGPLVFAGYAIDKHKEQWTCIRVREGLLLAVPVWKLEELVFNQLTERLVWLAWIRSREAAGKPFQMGSKAIQAWLWGSRCPPDWRQRLQPVIESLLSIRLGNWSDAFQDAFDLTNEPFLDIRAIGRTMFRFHAHPSFLNAEAGTNAFRDVFVPAHLGRLDACGRLSASEKRLLQTIFGRLQRAVSGKSPRKLPHSVIRSLKVDTAAGGGAVEYIPLRRRPVAWWLERAGYQETEAWLLCSDLASLADRLGLLVAAIRPSGEWLTIQELAQQWWNQLWKTPSGLQELEACCIRLYAPADWLNQWQAYFGWPPPEIETFADRIGRTKALPGELRQWMTDQGLRQLDVAKRLDVSPAYVSRILSGQRCPKRLMQRIRGLISSGGQAMQDKPVAPRTRRKHMVRANESSRGLK